MARKKTSAKSGGRRTNGNVVLDLGETMDEVVETAVRAGYSPKGLGKAGRPWSGGVMGGFRPGFGFRPGVHRSELGAAISLPSSVDPMRLIGGAFAGTAANRVLYRLTPYVAGGRLTSKLLVDVINGAIGALPFFLIRKNSFTVGFAIPGVINLIGSLADAALNAINLSFLPSPALSGQRMGQANAQSARAAIDQIRARIGTQRPALGLPRVTGTRVAV